MNCTDSIIVGAIGGIIISVGTAFKTGHIYTAVIGIGLTLVFASIAELLCSAIERM